MVFLTFVEITCTLQGNFNKMSNAFGTDVNFISFTHTCHPHAFCHQISHVFSLMDLIIHILSALSTIAFPVERVITQPVKCALFCT